MAGRPMNTKRNRFHHFLSRGFGLKLAGPLSPEATTTWLEFQAPSFSDQSSVCATNGFPANLPSHVSRQSMRTDQWLEILARA